MNPLQRKWMWATGTVVALAAIGTAVLYAVGADNAPSLLIATIVGAVVSALCVYIVGRRSDQRPGGSN